MDNWNTAFMWTVVIAVVIIGVLQLIIIGEVNKVEEKLNYMEGSLIRIENCMQKCRVVYLYECNTTVRNDTVTLVCKL